MQGALAERLGTGLQNLLQRFDSARHLKKPSEFLRRLFCCFGDGFCGQAVVSSATYHPAGRGTNAAIQMGALKTRGQMRVMVLVPALSGIRAGSRVQKNCSSV